MTIYIYIDIGIEIDVDINKYMILNVTTRQKVSQQNFLKSCQYSTSSDVVDGRNPAQLEM